MKYIVTVIACVNLAFLCSSCGCECPDVASTPHAVTVSVPAMPTAAGAHSKAGKGLLQIIFPSESTINDKYNVYHMTLTYTTSLMSMLSSKDY